MRSIFILFLFVLQTTAHAETSEDELLEASSDVVAADAMILKTAQERKCDFTINCLVNDVGYSFEYKSLGEDCNESNPGQLVFLNQSKRVPMDIRGSSFKTFEDLGPSPQLCEVKGKKYPAQITDEQKLILYTRIDGRPSYDKLGALLIDLKKGKVLRYQKDLGEIKNSYFAFLPTEKGMKTRLIKEYLKSIKCDCDAAFIDDWKEITVSGGDIKTRWMKPKP